MIATRAGRLFQGKRHLGAHERSHGDSVLQSGTECLLRERLLRLAIESLVE